MIRHIVMWKFKDEQEENIIIFREKLLALSNEIPEIISAEVGININAPEKNYDAVLVSDFNTLDDLNKYINNPKHKIVSGFCKSIRVDRVAVDYEY